MSDRPIVLLPVEVLEGESIPDGIPELLARAHVILLGYHVIPEQTPAGQAEMQFEDQANARLDEFQSIFEDAGATVDRQLVFTQDSQQTFDRISKEYECDAILVPDTTTRPDEILVPVSGAIGVEQFGTVVAGLFDTGESTVTLYHVLSGDQTAEQAQELLESVADKLVEQGFDRELIKIRIDESNTPDEAIIEASADFDAIVVGETDPTIATYLFGMLAENVAKRFLGPVFVVQREPTTEE